MEGKNLEKILNNLSAESTNLSDTALEHIQQRITRKNISTVYRNDLLTIVREVVRGDDYNSVPLILIEKRSDWMTEEKLGKLFERVN